MDSESIAQALAVVGEGFGDRRLHHFEVTVGRLEGDVCELAGSVLDEETLDVVTKGLGEAFPALTVRSDGVRVLTGDGARRMTVGTNLTDLKGAPTGGSETLSQLVAGWTVTCLDEEGGWLYVRQDDGYLGWLAARRMTEEVPPAPTHVVAAPVARVYETAEAADEQTVTRLVAGTPVAVEEVRGAWSYLTLSGYGRGWVRAASLRALERMPGDEASRREQVMADAFGYAGVPYLWGGISALGIDCSGFVQLLHRLSGVTIPRDADMQYAAGKPVEAPFAPGDLFFFGSGEGRRRITHVGMSLGGWRMIHSSGPRNGVYVDDVQEAAWLREIFAGARRFLSDGD